MAINREQTVDIVEDLVSLINLEITGTGAWVDNGDGTFTLPICNTYWLNTQTSIIVDAVTYSNIVVVQDTSVTVTAATVPTSLSFFLNVPSYYHGTVIQTNQELSNDSKSVAARTPMVYLLEVISDKVQTKENPIERVTDLRLFFLADSNFEDGTTDSHYTDEIIPMRSMCDFFVENIIKENTGIDFDDEYEVVNHVNFGVYTTDKGHTKKIFNDDYSGVELRITLPIKRNYLCGCDKNYPKIRYIDSDLSEKSANYGEVIVCTPTGSSSVNVSNSDDSYDVDTSVDLELPDITFTDTDGSSSSVPAVTNITALPYKRSSEIYKTGQTTSYATGDDGDLEDGNGVDFYTLSENNPFGNAYRFTDFSGVDFKTGSPTGAHIIDWSTADYVNETVLVYWQGIAAAATWSTQVTNMATDQASSGYATGWSLPNVKQLENCIDYGIAAYPTFFTNNSSDQWSSTTHSAATTNAFYANNSRDTAVRTKTNVEPARQVRLYTFTEVGV